MVIKNIIFDFGGVLFHWNPRYLYRAYFKTEDEMEYFLANICTDEWNAEQDRGRPFAEGVQILQQKFPEYAEPIGLFKDQWHVMLKSEIPETVELLYQFRNQGYQIFGLTNWSAETIPIVFNKYDFLKEFDGIVVSGQEKLIKPDKRIYTLLLERYALKAKESLFIDDNINNIKTAKEVGMQVILYDNIFNVKNKISSIIHDFA
ncbi:MAG: HAD family phosphatase [Candidatus Riflebacteria bacterium]|nr:HAD family phosphatase [Candidatus Riflebacteria bacterium]